MATLQYNFGDLFYDTMLFAGTVTPTNTTPVISTSTDDAKKIVNDAYRKFVTVYDWSFLKPEWQMTTITNQWVYDLPEGFVGILTPIYYSLADSYSPIQQTSPEDILCRRSISDVDSYPERFAIRAGKYDPKFGQRFELLFHPIPDSSYTLNTRISIMPVKLESDGDLPIGGAEYAGLLKQMCLAEAELVLDKIIGIQRAEADRLLMAAIRLDMGRNPRTLGRMLDSRWQGIPEIIGLRNGDVYYEGVRCDLTGN